ncbi:glycosyltransferase family 2 protein [Mycoplasmatota bacterium]|nr:glycosyltransferase family 2 protein [Mycoplasmatota bacterium]
MKQILICCVNYHNPQEVIDYITHLRKQTVYEQIDVVVTDNSESKDEFQFLKMHLDDIYVYQSSKNLGYIHGINYGLKKYLETHSRPEWIVISNTDITYQDNEFFEKLFTFYPDGYDCVVAPCIYSLENNSYQNPLVINRYTKLKMFFLTYVFKFTFIERCFDALNNIKNKFQLRKISLLPNQEIYSAHGSCLIINKCYFEKGGNLEYGSFLFGEELFISEQVRQLEGKVFFDNRLKVNHHEHATISKEKRKRINQFYFDSMEYLYKEYY